MDWMEIADRLALALPSARVNEADLDPRLAKIREDSDARSLAIWSQYDRLDLCIDACDEKWLDRTCGGWSDVLVIVSVVVGAACVTKVVEVACVMVDVLVGGGAMITVVVDVPIAGDTMATVVVA